MTIYQKNEQGERTPCVHLDLTSHAWLVAVWLFQKVCGPENGCLEFSGAVTVHQCPIHIQVREPFNSVNMVKSAIKMCRSIYLFFLTIKIISFKYMKKLYLDQGNCSL